MTPGVHRMEAAAYHADPCPEPSLSSTLAKVMLSQSPLHAWTASQRLNPDYVPAEKKTFDIGRAAHRLVLGAGSDFEIIPTEILSSDGGIRTKEAKEFVESCRVRGITPLKEAEADSVRNMAVLAEDKLARLGITFDPAHSENCAFAQIDGVWCRAMVDNAPPDGGILWDFKTCESASPEACERSIMNYGYDIQAAHYLDTWKAATGEDRTFRFVFQEKSAPHEICVVELGPDSLIMARKKITRAREMWRVCLDRNEWPGYPPGVHRIELPEWVHSRWLDRESAEADYKRRTGRDVLEMAMAMQAPEGM